MPLIFDKYKREYHRNWHRPLNGCNGIASLLVPIILRDMRERPSCNRASLEVTRPQRKLQMKLPRRLTNSYMDPYSKNWYIDISFSID